MAAVGFVSSRELPQGCRCGTWVVDDRSRRKEVDCVGPVTVAVCRWRVTAIVVALLAMALVLGGCFAQREVKARTTTTGATPLAAQSPWPEWPPNDLRGLPHPTSDMQRALGYLAYARNKLPASAYPRLREFILQRMSLLDGLVLRPLPQENGLRAVARSVLSRNYAEGTINAIFMHRTVNYVAWRISRNLAFIVYAERATGS